MAVSQEILAVLVQMRGAAAFRAEALGVGTSLQQIDDRAKHLSGTFDKGAKKAGSFRQSLTIMRKSMVGLAGAATAYGFVRMGQDALEFEDNMARVRATLSGTEGFTAAKFEKMGDAAMHWGERTKFSSQDVAQGMYELAAVGLKTDEVLAAIGGTTNMAAAGSVDMATAAKIQATTLRQFNIDASKAGYVADVFTVAMNEGSATMQEMANSLKYAGPIARTFGTSMLDTMTAITLLGNVGIRGSQAGTTLRTSLTKLLVPSKQAKKGLATLGVTMDDLKDKQGNLKPMPILFRTLNKAYMQMVRSGKGGQAKGALALISGREASTGFLRLVQSASKEGVRGKDGTMQRFGDLRQNLGNSKGAAQRFGEELQKTVGAQMANLQNTIGNILIRGLRKHSTSIQNWIKGITKFFRDLQKPTSDLRQRLQPAIDAVGAMWRISQRLAKTVRDQLKIAFGVALIVLEPFFNKIKVIADKTNNLDILFGVLVTTLGAYYIIIKTITVATKIWAVATGILNHVMKMNPMLKIVMVAIFLAALFVQLWKRSETFRNAVYKIRDAALAVWEGVKKFFGELKDQAEKLWEKVKLVGSRVKEFFGGVRDKIADIYNNFIKPLVDKVAEAAEKIGQIIEDVRDFFGFGGSENLGTAGFDFVPGANTPYSGVPSGGTPEPEEPEEPVTFDFSSQELPSTGARTIELPGSPESMGLAAQFAAASGEQTIRVPLYLDGRQVAEAVAKSGRDRIARS